MSNAHRPDYALGIDFQVILALLEAIVLVN